MMAATRRGLCVGPALMALVSLWACAPARAADTASGGVCLAGQLLQPGEQCVYPGTDEPFGVGADGSGAFLFGTFGGSIGIDSEWEGQRYDLAATDVGGGVWRIDRVGGVAGDGRTAGAALVLSDLDCHREPSAAGTAIRIEGVVQARASVSSVVLTGRIDGGLMDVVSLGRLSADDAAPFLLRGAAPSSVGEFVCAVDVEYFNVGALRDDPPLRVKWPGRTTR